MSHVPYDGGRAPDEPGLHITIITGLSGAGKSQAVATFEDMGYFCIDNLPPQMLPRLAELFALEGSKVNKVAVVFDARGGAYFDYLDQALHELDRTKVRYRIVFLEASDEALVARYQSTRRPHPKAVGEDLLVGIAEERRMLRHLRERADVVVETTDLNVHELRRRLRETLLAGELHDQLLVTFMSFGYKFGLPSDADIVLDARFLPNPHWIAELRPLTGLDLPVREYVLGRSESEEFLVRASSLIHFLVPLYLAEAKTQLVVAVGCTGGRHRSVALAEAFARRFAPEASVVTSVRHRDVERTG
jgi:UPF0042 nucleotide-binding protein